jgi:Zn-dependent protease
LIIRLAALALLVGYFIAVVDADLQVSADHVFLASMLFVFFWLPPLIVLHEFAHAATAWLLRAKVGLIVIGHGTVLAKRRIGPTLIILRALPFSGFVIPILKDSRFWRLRDWLIVAAGPSIHLLVAVLGTPWMSQAIWSGREDSLVHVAFFSLVMANWFLAGSSLFPQFVHLDGMRYWNDGLQLLMIPFYRADSIAQAVRDGQGAQDLHVASIEEDWPRLAEMYRESAEGSPDDHSLRLNYLHALLHSHQSDEALYIARHALARDDLEPAVEAAYCICLVDALLLLDDPKVLPEADEASQRGLALTPKDPRAQLARGIVLLELGQPEEARRLLHRARRKSKDRDLISRIDEDLARVYEQLGRDWTARLLLCRARLTKM